jgi:hypothetical protein
MPAWQLPDQISDILPLEAARLERLRRRLLDLYRSYGYALVQPPMLEHLESLMIDQARDLDLRTFKVVDQACGPTSPRRPRGLMPTKFRIKVSPGFVMPDRCCMHSPQACCHRESRCKWAVNFLATMA